MKKRYSKYIRPLYLLLDLTIINLVVYLIFDKEFLNAQFLTYLSLFWIISSLITDFYKIKRFTTNYQIITLLFRQFIAFILGYFAYFGIFREGDIVHNQFLILTTILSTITFFKFLSFFALKKYRKNGNNFRRVVFLGKDNTTKKFIKLFKEQKSLGYKYLGYFSNIVSKNKDYIGSFEDSFSFVQKNEVDEIYCSLTELNQEEIKELRKLTALKDIKIKLIPNSNEFYSKNQKTEYYNNNLVVLKVEKLPFDFAENKILKRIFDIVFSILICIFLLSWLIPVLWILMKFDSKGSLIFKQKREGLDSEQFVCFKFRSMKVNDNANKVHAVKNDTRVTKLGSFLRKTSIDELPQFFNVLEGHMSVVGPRPHLKSFSKEYQKDVENYMERHQVKPGITGLAQVSGFRGEIKKKEDIQNRIRLDIFYIENWSFLLDVKIVLQTVFNVFKGEKNAY